MPAMTSHYYYTQAETISTCSLRSSGSLCLVFLRAPPVSRAPSSLSLSSDSATPRKKSLFSSCSFWILGSRAPSLAMYAGLLCPVKAAACVDHTIISLWGFLLRVTRCFPVLRGISSSGSYFSRLILGFFVFLAIFI